MNSYIGIYEKTKENLGRPLDEKEKAFLKWMYTQHQNEAMVGKSLSVYSNIKRENKIHY